MAPDLQDVNGILEKERGFGLPDSSTVCVLRDEENKVIAFAAAHPVMAAAGSWVDPSHRGKKLTYKVRKMLEDKLREQGITGYIAVPGTDAEYALFRKYGETRDAIVQIKDL